MTEKQEGKQKNKKVAIIITAIVLLILVCCGVGYTLAQITITINIGGNISFNAGHVYATVSDGAITGGLLEDSANKLKTLTYDVTGEEVSTEDINSWSGLSILFDENGSDITLSFKVTNNSAEKDLILTIGAISGNYNNVGKTITVNNVAKNENDTISIAKKSDEDTSSENIAITFSITNKNLNANVTNFGFSFTLTNSTESN